MTLLEGEKMAGPISVLNAYAGVGGNRKMWEHCEVTAVERNPKIAAVYQKLNPQDTVIIGDAHQYIFDHHAEFDFIWSSPPCQSHTKMVKASRHKPKSYPDLRLYEEILFLQNFCKCRWVVENVRPYYEPLIEPTVSVGRHLFWSNFDMRVEDVKRPKNFINSCNVAGKKAMMDWLGLSFEENIYYEGNHCPAQVLRNCVHPLVGKQIFEQAFSAIKL